MNPVRPRALTHRGVIEAAGFLFDLRLLGVAEARRRVLSVWAQGAQVFHIDDLFLVRLPATRRTVCATAIGSPLVSLRDALLAAPLADDECRALGLPPNAVVIIKGGEATDVQLSDSLIESPAGWFDVGAFTFVEMASLGAFPPQPGVVAEKPEFAARDKLAGVPPEAPGLAEVVNALRSAGKPKATTRQSEGSPASAAARLGTYFFSWLEKLFSGKDYAARAVRSASTRKDAPRAPRSEPSLAERLSAQWRKWAMRLLVATRLSRLIGKQQAQYIFRMMEMFERGDINEALRHAIPIDGLASALSAPSLWVPMPRLRLTFSPQVTRAGSTIYMDNDLLSELRKLYRASFEQLAAQGRIEEAAFVLAELLQVNEEAVAFLERHGKLKLAAEMAEARDLPPGLVVRQWFIAGDKARALAIAKRTKAFADAVMRLEQSDKKEAEILRLLWAGALAEAGDYAAAVDVIWVVGSARALAVDWMNKAIATGGAPGARMLARKVSLLPATFDEVREQTLNLLADEGAEGSAARLSFATSLLTGERTPQAKTLARAAVRTMLRDAAQTFDSIPAHQYRNLIEFSADKALQADAPPLPVGKAALLAERREPLMVRILAADVGATAIHDVALLADGRVVAALGEAGVRMLARDGRVVAHFDAPAHRLVMSDHGDRAIAMARRGEVWKLARLDFLGRRADDWCEARVDAFAQDYDGSMWFVGCGEDFYAIDATAKGFDALWRVPGVEGGVKAIARSASSCRFLAAPWEYEHWHYDLPSLRLRSRHPMRFSDKKMFGLAVHLAISAEGLIADQSVYAEMDEANNFVAYRPRTLTLAEQKVIHNIIFDDGKPLTPAIGGRWAVAPSLAEGEARATLIDVKSGKVRAEIILERAETIAVRIQNDVLSLADNRGRLLMIDLRGGQRLRNMRV